MPRQNRASLKKIVVTTLALSSLVITPVVYAQEGLFDLELYQESVDLLLGVVDKQREVLELRNSDLDSIRSLDPDISSELGIELSDTSTFTTTAENSLGSLDDANVEDVLSEVHLNLFRNNDQIKQLNVEHEEKLIEGLNKSYVKPHKETISELFSFLETNKEFLNIEEYRNLKSELDDLDDALDSLEKQYSATDWVRLEENLGQLKEDLNEVVIRINLEISSE